MTAAMDSDVARLKPVPHCCAPDRWQFSGLAKSGSTKARSYCKIKPQESHVYDGVELGADAGPVHARFRKGGLQFNNNDHVGQQRSSACDQVSAVSGQVRHQFRLTKGVFDMAATRTAHSRPQFRM